MEKEKLLKQFGMRLKELRAGNDISQEALADRCQMDRTYISGLERGVRNPTLTCIVKVANGLNMRADQLLKGLS